MDNLGLDSALKNITEDCLQNLLPKPRALTSMVVSLMAWQGFFATLYASENKTHVSLVAPL